MANAKNAVEISEFRRFRSDTHRLGGQEWRCFFMGIIDEIMGGRTNWINANAAGAKSGGARERSGEKIRK